MSNWPRTAPFLLALALAGCVDGEGTPRPQALVVIDTDLTSPGSIDRVRIQLLREDGGDLVLACDGCTREVFVEDAAQWPLSFGVEPPADGGARWVRVIGFEDGRAIFGEVFAGTAVDTVARLRFEDTVTAQLIFLSGDCVGRPADLVARSTCVEGTMTDIGPAPDRDPSLPTAEGTHRREYARTCSSEAQTDSGLFDEEVCIGGGTFWMGDIRRQGLTPIGDAVPEHLVTLSPFFLDRHEYTVGRYRAALAAGFVAPRPAGTTAGCTAGAPDGTGDNLPLNCVNGDTARAACLFEGRRLPTEAEWEWAAGSREVENLYPWGGLDRLGPTRDVQSPSAVTEPLLVTYWTEDVPPEPAEWEMDATEVDGIINMGWNVQEWVDDDYQLYTARCWAPENYGPNPRCTTTEGDELLGQSIRGGYWYGDGDRLAHYRPMAVTRTMAPSSASGDFVGFRCARDDGA